MLTLRCLVALREHSIFPSRTGKQLLFGHVLGPVHTVLANFRCSAHSRRSAPGRFTQRSWANGQQAIVKDAAFADRVL